MNIENIKFILEEFYYRPDDKWECSDETMVELCKELGTEVPFSKDTLGLDDDE